MSSLKSFGPHDNMTQDHYLDVATTLEGWGRNKEAEELRERFLDWLFRRDELEDPEKEHGNREAGASSGVAKLNQGLADSNDGQGLLNSRQAKTESSLLQIISQSEQKSNDSKAALTEVQSRTILIGMYSKTSEERVDNSLNDAEKSIRRILDSEVGKDERLLI